MHDTLALVLQRSQLTRAALLEHVDDAERILRLSGIRPEDRVALHLVNTAEAVVVFLALARIGCSIVVSEERAFRSRAELVEASGCSWLIVDRLTTAEPPDSQSDLHTLVLSVVVSMPVGRVEARRADQSEYVLFPPSWLAREDGIVMVTSGTTGTPALVEKMPAHVIMNAQRTAGRIGYEPSDVLAPILPISHQYGFSVLIIGLTLGLPVVLGNPLRTLELLRLARRFGATILDAIPRSHDIILRAIESGRIPLASLATIRYWCVGGAPVTGALQDRAQRVYGTVLLDGYGSTELGNVAHVDPRDPSKLMPLDEVHIRIVRENGDECDSDEWGALWVMTPDAPGTSWHRTGDLAKVGAVGDLCVAGRDAAVSRRGEVLYPAAIEHLLARQGVHALCVPVAREDDGGEHRIVVVIEDPIRRGRDGWRSTLEAVLPPAWVPDKIILRDAFPRTPVSGKVDRARIREFVVASSETHDESVLPRVPFPARVEAISRTRSYLRRNRGEIVEILQEYSAREAAEIELEATLVALDGALGEIVINRPHAVPESWVYMPSNVVLYSYALYLLTPALYTDEIVFRPSSRTYNATVRLHNVLAGVHGLPITVFPGTQTEFRELRAGRTGTVVFTGKYSNAERVREHLGDGQLMIFFGQGTNPMIIGENADVDRSSRDAIRMRLLNSGQDCFGPDLHLVHRSVAESFVRDLVSGLQAYALEQLLLGRGDHLAVRDPLVLRNVVEHVGEFRDHIRWGGRIDLHSMLIEPVVLVWALTDAPDFGELFAPIFNIAVYDDEEQVRALLSRSFYEERSMCASLYGTSEAFQTWCANRVTVSVDATIIETDDPGQSFGGIGVMANYVATRNLVVPKALLVSAAVAEHAHVFDVPRTVIARLATPATAVIEASR
jgi:long-chain acyl-CoA synthetase